MEQVLGIYFKLVCCLCVVTLACSGGGNSEIVDASNSVADAALPDAILAMDASSGLDGAIDGAVECVGGTPQCTDSGGYEVCGDNGSGSRSFGQRIPCQDGNTCSGGLCGSNCVSPEILVLLDRSSSITNNWSWITDELADFIAGEQDLVRFGLRQFPSITAACSASSIVPIGLNSLSSITTAFAAPTVDAQTPLVAAMSDTEGAFGDPNEAQFIVLITDGDETCSSDSLPLLTEGLARKGIDTFVIGIGNGANPATVDAIATAGRTGPTGYSANTAQEFSFALQDIALRMRRCVCEPTLTSCVADEFRECAVNGLSFNSQTCADDGDTCTNDACDFALGCNVLDTSLGCDDGDACANADSCTSGACAGIPVACWADLSTTGAPTARFEHSAVWTGTEMIVWGGNENPATNTGARYSPATDSWTSMSTIAAPTYSNGRHSEIWTGTEMIVWGSDAFTNVALGARYNLNTDTWTAISVTNAPPATTEHHAVWTGVEMIVWDSSSRRGGRYTPGTDSWAEMSTVDAPSIRNFDTAVWTGTKMVVWGGGSTNTGAMYTPATDSWEATSAASAPSVRSLHAAVWTGQEMLVWGGTGVGQEELATGGRFDPLLNTWSAMTTNGAPDARASPSLVWTGQKAIIWGGNAGLAVATGGEYDPIADVWIDTVLSGSPSGRFVHTAVWSGNEMIVWGGIDSARTDTGGAYSPL